MINDDNIIDINKEINVETNEEEILNEIYDLSKKKKKNKKIIDKTNNSEKEDKLCDKMIYNHNNLYNYYYLLNRFYQMNSLKQNFNGNVVKVKGPIIVKISIRKIAWTNFTDVCESINRKNEYIYKYTLNELNANGSINEKNHFIIKGNFNQKNIENILKKYILNNVRCINCLSLDTTINKDLGRIHVMKCNMCKSTKNILV